MLPFPITKNKKHITNNKMDQALGSYNTKHYLIRSNWDEVNHASLASSLTH